MEDYYNTNWQDDVEDTRRAIMGAIREGAKRENIWVVKQWLDVLRELEGMGIY